MGDCPSWSNLLQWCYGPLQKDTMGRMPKTFLERSWCWWVLILALVWCHLSDLWIASVMTEQQTVLKEYNLWDLNPFVNPTLLCLLLLLTTLGAINWQLQHLKGLKTNLEFIYRSSSHQHLPQKWLMGARGGLTWAVVGKWLVLQEIPSLIEA